MHLPSSFLLDNQAAGFVLAAIAICYLSAWLLVHFVHQAETATKVDRKWWMVGTAVVAGTGVWTTHFVAMLGYRTDLLLNYDTTRTLCSALVAIVAVGGPLALSTQCSRAWTSAAAAAISGLGIAAMHLIGMAALKDCAQTQSAGLNVIACLIGAVFMATAQIMARRAYKPLVTVSLIVAAVCGTHFVSIAGTKLVGASSDQLLPIMQLQLGILAATGAATLLFGTLLALVVARRFEGQEAAHARILTTTLQNMSNGILKISGTEIIELYNEKLRSMLMLPPGNLVRGMTLTQFLELTGRANGWDQHRTERVLANHRAWMARSTETQVEHIFEDGRILSIVCQPIDGGAVLTFDDISQEKRAQQEILHLAYHDPLTGLANRRSLIEYMELLYSKEKQFDLLLIDLDRFKAVNDTFGHGIGDRLLVEVAERLRSQIGETGFVARLGGDEMAVITQLGIESVNRLAENIIIEVEKPYDLNDITVVIGCSIGLSGNEDQSSPEELMQRADIALYEAKRHGRGRAARYASGMMEAVAERHALEHDLRLALTEQQFHLAYQPIMSLADDNIVGYEALIRWQHPTRGFVSPASFIPLAEETGLIVPIGAWVLTEACRQAALWHAHQHVAVNVSAIQFRSPMLLAHITSALAESGLPPHRLEIELTETALVEDGRQIVHTLSALRRLGLKIAMDDFGTGYSSLAHLRDLPLDRIKIDRSFVAAALGDNHCMAVVKAITQMARDMNIRTIAEGVEEADQLKFLRRFGCDAVQGYLIGRPERLTTSQPPAMAI
ncbi:EAL domain-containing protein [Methylobacterium oryzae]|uniref:EAL domain-containing protein n=1 Tax=Methylobacterium oryzae TaxID=334852 RepID=UPI001F2CA894|nr:EAL domain-containing protein [Methylobacterium oryzae]UIN37784.1 EAL domain-containing protein [Methylobacterium oryzae]